MRTGSAHGYPHSRPIANVPNGASRMSRKLVELTFKLNGSGTAYEQSLIPLAGSLVDVAGLQWTIWFLNDGERLAGGIYTL